MDIIATIGFLKLNDLVLTIDPNYLHGTTKVTLRKYTGSTKLVPYTEWEQCIPHDYHLEDILEVLKFGCAKLNEKPTPPEFPEDRIG
jgi:hypothetical protein